MPQNIRNNKKCLPTLPFKHYFHAAMLFRWSQETHFTALPVTHSLSSVIPVVNEKTNFSVRRRLRRDRLEQQRPKSIQEEPSQQQNLQKLDKTSERQARISFLCPTLYHRTFRYLRDLHQLCSHIFESFDPLPPS